MVDTDTYRGVNTIIDFDYPKNCFSVDSHPYVLQDRQVAHGQTPWILQSCTEEVDDGGYEFSIPTVLVMHSRRKILNNDLR